VPAGYDQPVAVNPRLLSASQVITHKSKPQGPRSEVRTSVALMGGTRLRMVKVFQDDPVGCVRVLVCNVIAYVVEVFEGCRVESVTAAHAGLLRCASVFAFRRAKASSPSMGFTLSLFKSS
jgi:hypothetical protein